MRSYRVPQPMALPEAVADAGLHEARQGSGEPLGQVLALSADQVAEVLGLSQMEDIRFGEAAIRLGHASSDRVMAALSRQFDYPCVLDGQPGASMELVVLSRPQSPQAEAIRALRSQVLRRTASPANGPRTLAVISPDAGDGKSFLVANLAVALAQAGQRTLVVDADLRHPRQHEIFEVSNSAGLSSALLGLAEPQLVQAVGRVPGLYVLPVGACPPNPLELVERPAFRRLLEKLAARFDHVVVDTPAAVYGTDAHVIAERCGAALMVARRDASRVANLQALIEAVSAPSTTLLGVVMNEFKGPFPRGLT